MDRLQAADPQLHEDGSVERLGIYTIRTLAMDAVQKANSGHPGTPMALAPAGYTLWRDHLRYDPAMPDWPNRDRFVLSVGHASLLLYALLLLAGIEEIDADGRKPANPQSTSRRGSALCRSKTLAAAKSGWAGSPSRVIDTYASCS